MAKENVIILRNKTNNRQPAPAPKGRGLLQGTKSKQDRGKPNTKARLAQGRTGKQGHQTRDRESTKHERHPNNLRTDGFMTTEGLTASQHILTR